MTLNDVTNQPQDPSATSPGPVSASNALHWIAESRFLVDHLAAQAECGLPAEQAGIDQMHSQLQVVGSVLSYLTRNLGAWNTPERPGNGDEAQGLQLAIQRELGELNRAIDRLTAVLSHALRVLN